MQTQNRAKVVKISVETHKKLKEVLKYYHSSALYLNVDNLYKGNMGTVSDTIQKFLTYLKEVCHYDYDEIILISLGNYDVIETIQDKYTRTYNDYHQQACTTSSICDQWYANGYKQAIVDMNKDFNLEIVIYEN